VFRILLLFALIALPIRAWGQVPGGTDRLSLEQAVTLALQSNRLVKVAEIDVQKAANDIKAARTRRLPAFEADVLELRLFHSVDLAFAAGAFGGTPQTGPIPLQDTVVKSPPAFSSIMLFRATQPISQLFQIHLGLDALNVGREIAGEKLRGERQDVANNVRQLYYGLSQTQSSMVASQDALKSYQEVQRVVEDLVKQEAALEGDRLSVQAQVAQEEHKLRVIENSAMTLKEQLNVVMGRDVRTAVDITPVPEESVFEIDMVAAERRVLDQRSEVREAALKIKQADLDVRLKRAERIPEVAATIGFLGLFNIDVLPAAISGAGVVAKWDVWDWGRKTQEAEAKKHTADQARLGLQEAQARVVVDFHTKYRKVADASSLLRVLRLARDAAREKLRVTTEQYRQQAITFKDVLQAQAALSERTEQYQQALASFYAAKADFERALGGDQ